jgi:hypothetical protein
MTGPRLLGYEAKQLASNTAMEGRLWSLNLAAAAATAFSFFSQYTPIF